jgi:hypothetical protein
MPMTTETRTTIQLSDLKAVEIECTSCHSRIARPIGTLLSPALGCPECNSNWTQFRGTLEFLAKFTSQIAKVAAIDDPKNDAPFVVRFEIAQPRKENQ